MKWTESIDIDRPAAEVQAAIADEHALMQWSAWPAATGYTCAVDGDGTSIGSAIVFRNASGTEQGRQHLAAVSPTKVEYRLRNRGPAGRDMTPEVDFRIEPLSPSTARVHLDFRNQVPLPPPLRQIASRLIGRKVRALHVEDLRLLKEHVEQNHPAASSGTGS
jgi:carbon monoxide dehydrogenase subunit G